MNKFRADIQGLRAFAVLSVVLFHFNPAWLPGGFIGVDIFFVISGYLMTSIVMKAIAANTFSLSTFYIARIARILPALLMLCITMTILGFIFLNLVDASQLATHAASAISFLSNIVFWSESGYFDEASKYNWLLHTWSLSVEWQFYMIYPVIMLLAAKIFPLEMFAKLTLLMALICFGYSIWASTTMPSAAYFLFPTRAWELLIGGLAFFYPLRASVAYSARIGLELFGVLLIVGSTIWLNKDYSWPGTFALIPVLGALLVLLANNQKSILTGRAIAQKIGTWSYSVYLWHWPLVVLIKYFELPTYTWFAGIVFSFILGWLSYTYIETRFGKQAIPKIKYGPKTIYLVFGISISVLGCFVFYKGTLWQKNIEKIEPFLAGQKYFEGRHVRDASGGKTYFLNGARQDEFDFLAIGDSNLSHYVYGITKAKTARVILSWDGACLSLPNYMTKPTETFMNINWQEYCKNNIENIERYPNKPIIWAQQWQPREMICTKIPCEIVPIKANYFDMLENQIKAMINIIGNDRQLILIGQVPAPTNSVYRCMKGFNTDICARVSNENANTRIKVNQFLRSMTSLYPNIQFIDPYSFNCDEAFNCRNIIDGKSIFYDEGHLSAFGSHMFWKAISNKLVN
ncbi:acyltransferase family protein [Glaciecola petra]|uniref:Acyltransferase family protein n=1 Tax=Glaciecola petra TaxID=3075602 RepID=A0ABU2ZTH8_9ALTE|nr:acyltransferase family protein [Aestuariibacter sp. P117]MDT0595947.1 acyltransferase family protein [Aestuariibacter sp. P117]